MNLKKRLQALEKKAEQRKDSLEQAKKEEIANYLKECSTDDLKILAGEDEDEERQQELESALESILEAFN